METLKDTTEELVSSSLGERVLLGKGAHDVLCVVAHRHSDALALPRPHLDLQHNRVVLAHNSLLFLFLFLLLSLLAVALALFHRLLLFLCLFLLLLLLLFLLLLLLLRLLFSR